MSVEERRAVKKETAAREASAAKAAAEAPPPKTELEKENDALRKSLGLLEENADLRRRIQALEKHSFTS